MGIQTKPRILTTGSTLMARLTIDSSTSLTTTTTTKRSICARESSPPRGISHRFWRTWPSSSPTKIGWNSSSRWWNGFRLRTRGTRSRRPLLEVAWPKRFRPVELPCIFSRFRTPNKTIFGAWKWFWTSSWWVLWCRTSFFWRRLSSHRYGEPPPSANLCSTTYL